MGYLFDDFAFVTKREYYFMIFIGKYFFFEFRKRENKKILHGLAEIMKESIVFP